jgi:hypothetical protein
MIIKLLLIMIFTLCFISVLCKKKEEGENYIDHLVEVKEDIHLEHPDVIYDYDKNSIYTFLKFHHNLVNKDRYLSWKYSGFHQNKSNYDLVLMDYKTAQNEFILENDKGYIEQFYVKYNLQSPVENIRYLISTFNKNPHDYLEVELYEGSFIVKLNLFAMRGTNKYVHYDEKYNLYLLDGINYNVAKFVIG